MNDSNYKTPLVDQIRSIGLVVSAVLGLLTTLAPIFGETGLIYAVPMPENLSVVGPLLATIFSLVVGVVIFVRFSGTDSSAVPWIGTILSFVVALFTTGVYLSWIEDGQVTEPGSIWVFGGNVVAVFVFTIAVMALTSTFAFLGVALLQKETISVNEQTSIKKREAEKLVSTPQPDGTAEAEHDDSIENLFRLVRQAEWTQILEIAQRRPRLGYWKLYEHIATSILGQVPQKSMLRARSLGRVLSAATRIIPSPKKVIRRLLSLEAQLLVEAGLERSRLSQQLAAADSTQIDMMGIGIGRFTVALANPTSYGLDRMYFDAKQAVSETIKLYDQLDPTAREQVALAFQGKQWMRESEKSLQRLRNLVGHEPVSVSEEVKSQYMGFIGEAQEALGCGSVSLLSSRATELGKELTERYESLPGRTVAKNQAYEAAVRAHCAAAAASAHEVESATAVPGSELGKYVTAMTRLWTLASRQGTALCSLASDYQEVVGPFLPQIEETDKDYADLLRSVYTKMRATAEKARGAPCP